MIFLTLFAIPFLIALLSFLFGRGKVTFPELCVQLLGAATIAGISVAAIFLDNTRDVEVWNGRVASKRSVHVSCEHSYSCNCRTVCSSSGKSQSCSTVCDTCYEHNYDVDWGVWTTNKELIDIDRVDRQGTTMPARYASTQIGEPTSRTHTFTNYVKGAPDTLFRHQGLVEKYANRLPAYPQAVYDYYRLNRLVVLGTRFLDSEAWNSDLSQMNADLGAAKQANIIVVIASALGSDFGQALEQHWLGGKKNDIVVVLGVGLESEITWSYVIAWTDNQMFKVALRDSILDTKVLNRTAVMAAISTNVKNLYVRKHMKDFEYLAASITPTPTELIIALIVGTLVASGLAVWFWREDPFGDFRIATSVSRVRRRNGLHSW